MVLDDIDMSQSLMVMFFHLVSLVVGAFIVFLGYKLFTKGVIKDAGDTSFKYGKYEFALKRGAPGTFFVIFGCGVIVYSMYKGIDFKTDTQTTTYTSMAPGATNLPASTAITKKTTSATDSSGAADEGVHVQQVTQTVVSKKEMKMEEKKGAKIK